MRLPPEEIVGLLEEMKQESQELIKQIHAILWHMRGGITREEAWSISFNERKLLVEDINTRIKNAKDTGVPLI